MKVKAIKTGFYVDRVIEPGTVFNIKGEHELGRWMQVLEPDKPAKDDKPDKPAKDAK